MKVVFEDEREVEIRRLMCRGVGEGNARVDAAAMPAPLREMAQPLGLRRRAQAQILASAADRRARRHQGPASGTGEAAMLAQLPHPLA